ncbi:MAG: hypothetical protein ACREDM_01485 [Methylocella sp.]
MDDMSIFARTFCIKRINDQVLEENPWFKDMLLYWRPAGDALRREMPQATELLTKGPPHEEDPERLRLAIRDGYINFYRGGQSIAKIDFDSKGNLQAKIHNKFVNGKQGSGQTYVTLNATGLRDEKTGSLGKYKGLADLRRWVSNANEYIGDEKQFVDQIVARNPNVVDLEMALPAYDPKEKTAPRMDLVALEPVGDRWRIVFWEVKLAGDSRARCKGDRVWPTYVGDEHTAPKVLRQLWNYTRWLRHDGHRELVETAYQKACQLLVEFHELAKIVNPQIEELGPGIVAAALLGAPRLRLDDNPRLLIGDLPGEDGIRNSSFVQNGHLKKLCDEPSGIHVQMVSGFGDMALETRA